MLLATETRVHWRLLFTSFKKNKWEEKSWKLVGKYFKKLCGPLSRRFIVVAWVAGAVMVLMMFRKNSLNWLKSFRQSFSKVKFLEFFTNFPPILLCFVWNVNEIIQLCVTLCEKKILRRWNFSRKIVDKKRNTREWKKRNNLTNLKLYPRFVFYSISDSPFYCLIFV